MASRIFSVIGDANVKRNMTELNIASREVMKNAQVINYVPPASFDAAFQEIRPESEVRDRKLCYCLILLDKLIHNPDWLTSCSP